MTGSLSLALLLMQAGGGPMVTTPDTPAVARHPFAVGESLSYSAKLGILRLGSATVEVAGLDTLRGDETYRFRFQLEAGNMFFRLNDVMESWTRVEDLASLRMRQDHDENGRKRLRVYEIFPDSGFYRQDDQPPEPTVAAPLDDAAFLYFVRSIPLEVGKTYRFNRYFRREKNPMIIRVLKREEMKLPDGSRVMCLVLNPEIDEKGMFSKRAEARLWLTDDARRIPVQIQSRYEFGKVTLRLEEMRGVGGRE